MGAERPFTGAGAPGFLGKPKKSRGSAVSGAKAVRRAGGLLSGPGGTAQRICQQICHGKGDSARDQEGTIPSSQFCRVRIPERAEHGGAVLLYFGGYLFYFHRGVGSNGIAALKLALPAYSLLNGIGLMVGMGGATRYSILRARAGRTRPTRCSLTLREWRRF